MGTLLVVGGSQVCRARILAFALRSRLSVGDVAVEGDQE